MEKNKGWRWRTGEIGLKEYYQLSYEHQRKYIEQIETIPTEERSSGDDYLIQMYGHKKTNKQFLQLDEE
jgi:hypothetical protein